MWRIGRVFRVLFASAAMLAASCAGPDAYVLNPGEFNRESPTFAKDPENIDSVTICYNKFGTKPEIIAKMAEAECEKFNKKVKFRRQTIDACPLFTPVAAIYDCVEG